MFYLFFVAAVALAGVLLTVAVRWWAVKNKIVNNPNPIIPQHVKPIAYLGGAAIFLTMVLNVIVIYFIAHDVFDELLTQAQPVYAIVTGSILYLTWGIYDDLKQLKPLPKFAGQVLIAIIAVALGLHTSFFAFKAFDYLFSAFWILFTVNALNFTDVCDGLVSSICTVSFFTIGLLVPELRLMSCLVAAATAGFLFFNFPKASIFLGDAGSHLLGFLLAATAITQSNRLPLPDAIISMVLLSSVPLFELIFITVIRIRKGIPWYKGSPDHFSLRMQKSGFKRWQIDVIAAFVSIAFVSIACLMPGMERWLRYTLFAVALIMYALMWKVLLQWEVPPKK